MNFLDLLVNEGLSEYTPFNDDENPRSMAGRIVHSIVLSSKDKKELRKNTLNLEHELDQLFSISDKTIAHKRKMDGYMVAIDILDSSRPLINTLYKMRSEYPQVYTHKKIEGDYFSMESDWLMVRNKRNHLIEIKTGRESKNKVLQLQMQMLLLEEEIARTKPDEEPYIVGELVCFKWEEMVYLDPLDQKQKERLQRMIQRSRESMSLNKHT